MSLPESHGAPPSPGRWPTEPTTVVAPAPASEVLGLACVVKTHKTAELTHGPGVLPFLFGGFLSGGGLTSVTWNQSFAHGAHRLGSHNRQQQRREWSVTYGAKTSTQTRTRAHTHTHGCSHTQRREHTLGTALLRGPGRLPLRGMPPPPCPRVGRCGGWAAPSGAPLHPPPGDNSLPGRGPWRPGGAWRRDVNAMGPGIINTLILFNY